ncbi:MAG: hypothetical protein OEZ01_06755 [Candidatus Heimdallarchaeota archaeon]|nr:hypothetical protein [Candidatus Heimdallarchaeota archaeon]MDH5645689.1 hypothetical protein [Candidatus Heimdallarchaeota archaeon]
MSEDSKEQTVQSILPLVKSYFLEEGSKIFKTMINTVEFTATQTKLRRGVSGSVLISTVYYNTEYGSANCSIALKFFEDKSSALNEIKNAMALEYKFKSAPSFGVPKVIFASTSDPILIVYEGVSGTNYDELIVENKAYEAGRLLSLIHGSQSRPVDLDIYRNLIRMLGSHISTTGMEKQLSNSLSNHFLKLEGALSGCDPFSDFHQSNVMISTINQRISKIHVIDPEFMQKGNFDRLEDVGTFFGHQLLDEFIKTNGIKQGLIDINEFFKGYQQQATDTNGMSLSAMYPRGNPIAFFIAQWAIMDALDIAINRGGDLNSPDVMIRLKFSLFVLDSVEIKFPAITNKENFY